MTMPGIPTTRLASVNEYGFTVINECLDLDDTDYHQIKSETKTCQIKPCGQ